ncbi:MAG: 2-C-methyl-D-erythritol 4-phosphate cytidylyltransferase [Phycisphaerales bacterium]|nr:2-C-methyl-D-erythritol 4-phosphate cytidylyltransferase [Phycisphaerales bacterium]
MQIAVIIAAAGASRRFSEPGDFGARSKLDEDLGGRPVLQRSVELFNKRTEVSEIIVAGPESAPAFAAFSDRHGDKLGLIGARLCRGGATHRYETIAAALQLVDASATHVAVHDGARPCPSEVLIDRVFRAAESFPAVVPGIDVSDTIKRVSALHTPPPKADPLAEILGAGANDADAARMVEQTLDRRNLVAVQTPQVFELALLRRAYAQKDLVSTDDAELVERLGQPVAVVDGEVTNIKITRPADLLLARAILRLLPPSQRETHKKF